MFIKTRLFIILTFIFCLPQCGWSPSKKANVLVVAVDSLGFDSINCSHEKLTKAASLAFFCNQAVRYTHAYAPSTLSQPTMTSVLTGEYPHEHKVFNNGKDFLSAKKHTVAEAAIENGYRTAFFSGGPPLFRKSGLSQGFEIFDDQLKPRYSSPYKPVDKVFSSFTKWLDLYVKGDAFFSTIYLADLHFPQVATRSTSGEVRAKNEEGQLAELSESFLWLSEQLQKRGLWQNTYVVLVGLNGRDNTLRGETIKPTNLHSENLHVGLLIKPESKKRDLSLHWAIDKNVSLVDLGATLYELVGSHSPSVKNRVLEVSSLAQTFTVPEPNWSTDRVILYESSWSAWMGAGEKVLGARKGHYNVILGRPAQIYNTLIDKDEVLVMSNADPLWGELYQEVNNLYLKIGLVSNGSLDESLKEKIRIARQLWSNQLVEVDTENELQNVILNFPWDKQLISWFAQRALVHQNWKRLEKLAAIADEPAWLYVVYKHKGKAQSPNLSGCGVFFDKVKRTQKPTKKQCNDATFIALLNWLNERENNKKNFYLEVFWRLYLRDLVDEQIARYNYINYLTWDVDPQKPRGPSHVDLMLHLPENKNYKKIIDSRVKRFLK